MTRPPSGTRLVRSTRLPLGDLHPRRRRRDAFRQADLPLAFGAVDRKEEDGGGRWMVDGSIQDQEVRPELADRERLAVEHQVHFHIGGMPGVTVRSEDGRRHNREG